ncbi:MAG TPA: GDP-mannose 4,6-dehydratase [Acidobacteriota bacterium]
MRAFITGIGGFVGSHVAEHLLAQAWQVSGCLSPRGRDQLLLPIKDRLDLCQVEITDAEALGEALAQRRPEMIVHLAGLAHVGSSFSAAAATLRINLFGTLAVLEASRGLEPRPALVLAGSSEVYGAVDPRLQPLREDAPTEPDNPYGVSKLAAELLARQAGRDQGFRVVCARCFNHIGPRQEPNFLVASIAFQIARMEAGKQEPVLWVGNLESQRDFTDVRDIARAYRCLAEAGRAGQSYNVASGRAVKIAQVVEAFRTLATVDFEVRVDPNRLRPSDPALKLGDAGKLQAESGWRAEIGLEDSLRDTLDYWRGRLA